MLENTLFEKPPPPHVNGQLPNSIQLILEARASRIFHSQTGVWEQGHLIKIMIKSTNWYQVKMKRALTLKFLYDQNKKTHLPDMTHGKRVFSTRYKLYHFEVLLNPNKHTPG